MSSLRDGLPGLIVFNHDVFALAAVLLFGLIWRGLQVVFRRRQA